MWREFLISPVILSVMDNMFRFARFLPHFIISYFTLGFVRTMHDPVSEILKINNENLLWMTILPHYDH
jgi:hypothetical protein